MTGTRQLSLHHGADTDIGYLASMDGYTDRFSLITDEIENKVTNVDDTLVYSDSLEKNFNDVCKLLSVCHDAGLVVNSDKFQFCQEDVEFAGLYVTMEGVKPCKKFLESIKSFPKPNTLTEARSFFELFDGICCNIIQPGTGQCR